MVCIDDVKVDSKLSHDFTLDTVLQEIEVFYGMTTGADQTVDNVDIIDPDLADVLTYLDSSCQGKRKGNEKQKTELLRLRDRTDLCSSVL